ncbi:hypothetical protein PHYBLDRAFT_153446 [Phycomyces blakesleeanus NRRL 1555(-)]|uniref:Uncharacterized protein n=1 Tax=Phycomyces blakesleeanus (strain ATCC 8743b / DSM 1359 / FGSC 10004 / NBRC 33097 / NRRL 1555) TaxID=763407 RepID=A0A162TAK8_PHYB8|nr:hypothetical protein PHYBLDRAFT_153446 [Phycomyces blakesleeanus NRRL 1555(-)]OAD65543.1 hypothetical protein PHYBLDRAFT_153446 [Phycomyces blakesleeanus NRRL 1555(-)]|eukprot:XP_018283583.1 hypothetical protein PHYBLDRAFT_153446 [Phycomyces blakesleeanus NRRL 1555(-)]
MNRFIAKTSALQPTQLILHGPLTSMRIRITSAKIQTALDCTMNAIWSAYFRLVLHDTPLNANRTARWLESSFYIPPTLHPVIPFKDPHSFSGSPFI